MRKNVDLLCHIIQYCDEIDEAVAHFGDNIEALQSCSPYKNATAMCVFQIGELSAHLSDDFKAANNAIPWKQIRGMRNIVAHNYGDFSLKQLWNTITEDIPMLRAYCESILRRHAVLDQETASEREEERTKTEDGI
ncbi:MAG: DUF86 domain-containing protein [Peptococcaceae bacterium]|jgi:uncharacterized protein with HEPN domain|nr:DUF86 domain-containing protein [Peptococcaceae bacterium]